mmetsp:Transcript_19610/g.42719  ORF Transcript_19610/g.42719 Transcript_19610/m.42719 type:complete len:684 (+) Transcript_19610:373-2424(+)
MEARNRRRQQQQEQQRQREEQRLLRRQQARPLVPSSELSIDGGLGLGNSNGGNANANHSRNRNRNSTAAKQRTPLMTIDINTQHVPSSAMSTITTPTAVDLTHHTDSNISNNNGTNHLLPSSRMDNQENVSPPIPTTTHATTNIVTGTGRGNGTEQRRQAAVLVSPDGPATGASTRANNNARSRSSSRPSGANVGRSGATRTRREQEPTMPNSTTAPALTSRQQQQQQQEEESRQSRILAMVEVMSEEYSDNDNDNEEVQQDIHYDNFNNYDEVNEIDDSSSTNSELSMLSTALSVSGIDLPRQASSLSHPNGAQIDELKLRLAETATQLTTAEDELRQRVEVEGSLRFAVDVLRKRLTIRSIKSKSMPPDGTGDRRRQLDADQDSPDDEEQEELESVQEMLSSLGLRGPPSQQAARMAREMEDSELRTEGLRARLLKSDQQRKVAETRLRERNASVAELKAEIDLVKSKLGITQKRAEKEKVKLERRCMNLEASKAELKAELERFKNQLELVAAIKPSDESSGADAAAASSDRQLALSRKPSADEQETLEARAKAKVLLSLRKEADFTYKGAVKELEAMISQVYAKELKAEINAATGEEGVEASAVAQSKTTRELSELSCQRIDAVGEDFKLLLSTRDRMLKLHEKIKTQCESILAMSDTANEMEAGRWDATQVHPVLPGAC